MQRITGRVGNYRQLCDLGGRVAIVTGGVGLLGRHFCAGLADHGSPGGSRRSRRQQMRRIRRLCVEVRRAVPRMNCDITDPHEVKHIADRVERELGPIAVLHNNAASKGRNPDLFYTRVKDFDIARRETMVSTGRARGLGTDGCAG